MKSCKARLNTQGLDFNKVKIKSLSKNTLQFRTWVFLQHKDIPEDRAEQSTLSVKEELSRPLLFIPKHVIIIVAAAETLHALPVDHLSMFGEIRIDIIKPGIGGSIHGKSSLVNPLLEKPANNLSKYIKHL